MSDPPSSAPISIRRRSLRKALVVVGCVVGSVSFPAAAIGGVLIGMGAALHVWSKGCLEQNRRLTTAGPYRFTRNPFYLANLLIDVGLCCVIGRLWVPWIFLPIWWISYRDTIGREEERLSELFGGEYDTYRERVPALIPTGRSWPLDRVGGRFSLNNDGLARGAEYARVLGILIAPLAIWAAEIVRRLGTTIFHPGREAELALCLLIPALWAWKLALAEIFRRPETRIFPWRSRGRGRVLVWTGLVLAAGYLLSSDSWAVVLPVFWLGLALLDELGGSRSDHERVASWSYFPAVSALSVAIFGLVWFFAPIFR